jgi:DHA1 family multidrug resistance protein-like MFS transporter
MDREMRQTMYASSLGAVIIGGCATLSFPFLSIYLYDLGATEENISFWLAIASSITFLCGAVIMPIWGALSDRYGRKIIILRSAASLSIAYFVQGIVQTPFQLVLGRALQGLSFGFIPITQALLTEMAGPHAGTAVGMLISARSAGTVLGPFVGGILTHFFSLRVVFVLASMLEIVAFIAVIRYVHEPKHKKAPSSENKKHGLLDSFKSLSHNRVFMFLLGLMVVNQAAILLVEPIITLHIAHLTGSLENAAILSGTMLGAAGLACVLGGTWWGRFGENHGIRRAMIFTFLGDAFFAFLQFLAPNVWTFGLALFFFGFFIIGGATSITAAIAQYTEPEIRGSAYGLNATAMNIGNCTGPLLGGFIGSVWSVQAVFIFCAFVQLGCAFLVWHTIRAR